LLAYEGFAGRQSVALGKMIGGEGLAMTIAMSSENETLLRLAALEGLGAAFLPDWLTQHDVASGALVSVLEDNPELNASIHAVFPSRRLMPSRVRLLIDHLASTGLQI
jgi:DNA-binding transcriptional LysR family regulator